MLDKEWMQKTLIHLYQMNPDLFMEQITLIFDAIGKEDAQPRTVEEVRAQLTHEYYESRERAMAAVNPLALVPAVLKLVKKCYITKFLTWDGQRQQWVYLTSLRSSKCTTCDDKQVMNFLAPHIYDELFEVPEYHRYDEEDRLFHKVIQDALKKELLAKKPLQVIGVCEVRRPVPELAKRFITNSEMIEWGYKSADDSEA